MRSPWRTGALVVCAALVMLGEKAAGASEALLIRDVRVIDGTGAPPREHLSVLVRDGRIVAVGPDLPADDATVLDGTGATLLPGLIDSHVHFISAPGAERRHDTPAAIRESNRIHLAAYLACGVTTVLDAAADEATAHDIAATLAAGRPGPRVLTLGPMLTTPGSYPGNDRWGPVTSPAGVAAFLDRVQAVGGIGVKVPIEQVSGSFTLIPEDILAAVVRGAAARGLPLFVHATSAADQFLALDLLHPRALMHSAMSGRWVAQGEWSDGSLPDEMVARMVKDGTYQVTTLALIGLWPTTFQPSFLDDPLVRLTVPAPELATAREPDIVPWTSRELVGWVAPWLPAFTRSWVASVIWSDWALRDGLARSQRVVLQLQRAGVPIVVGSDAPSPWPLSINTFHGVSTLREIELVVGAGLTPLEAIHAATGAPAQMLGLAGEIGVIAPGARADLVVVAGDPSRDIRALRAVRWTIRDGVAQTPAEWMAAAR